MTSLVKALKGLLGHSKDKETTAPINHEDEPWGMEYEPYANRSFGDYIDSFHPEWIDQFPDFPYFIEGRPALHTGLVERMSYVFSISPANTQQVEDIIAEANKQIEMAHHLAQFPDFHVPFPDLLASERLRGYPSCWMRCIPFTEKTKRISKFPFKFEIMTGITPSGNGRGSEIQFKADLFPNGAVGRIESQFATFDKTGGFGHFWIVTSKLINGTMTVSRISESKPDGRMPTLYTIGR